MLQSHLALLFFSKCRCMFARRLYSCWLHQIGSARGWTPRRFSPEHYRAVRFSDRSVIDNRIAHTSARTHATTSRDTTLVLWNRGNPPSRRLTEGVESASPPRRAFSLLPRFSRRHRISRPPDCDQDRPAHHQNAAPSRAFLSSWPFATFIICFLSRPPFCCPRRYSTFQAIPVPRHAASRRVVSRRAGSSGRGARLRARVDVSFATAEPTRASNASLRPTESSDGSARGPPPRSLASVARVRADERIDWSQPCSLRCAPRPPLTLPGYAKFAASFSALHCVVVPYARLEPPRCWIRMPPPLRIHLSSGSFDTFGRTAPAT